MMDTMGQILSRFFWHAPPLAPGMRLFLLLGGSFYLLLGGS